jgi:hypothetical protein
VIGNGQPACVASLALAALALGVTVAEAQIRKFGDWLAVCDNQRNCTAYPVRYDSANSYLRIQRNAENVDFIVTIAVTPGELKKYRVTTEDQANSIIPESVILDTERVDKDGFSRFVTEETPQAMAKFVRKGGRLLLVQVEPPVKDPDWPNFDGTSLDGAHAALAWIDKQQKRADTEDGFVRQTKKLRSAVPPLPKLPQVTAAKPDRTPVPAEVPPLTQAQMNAACGKEQKEATHVRTTRISANTLMYWMFCGQYSGAYNINHAFLLVTDGKVAAAQKPRFVLPPEAAAFVNRNELTGVKNSITNPEWDGEYMVLTSFYQFRSVGDCGELGEWTWTGREFRLTELRKMPDCEGIPASDFPVVYRAQRK